MMMMMMQPKPGIQILPRLFFVHRFSTANMPTSNLTTESTFWLLHPRRVITVGTNTIAGITRLNRNAGHGHCPPFLDQFTIREPDAKTHTPTAVSAALPSVKLWSGHPSPAAVVQWCCRLQHGLRHTTSVHA